MENGLACIRTAIQDQPIAGACYIILPCNLTFDDFTKEAVFLHSIPLTLPLSPMGRGHILCPSKHTQRLVILLLGFIYDILG